MKIRSLSALFATLAMVAVPLVSASAATLISTTVKVTVTNPIGTTPGKVVIVGAIKHTTGTSVPTGTCQFVIDANAPITHAVNSSGRCSMTTHVALGQHAVKVTYSGSTVYAASSSTTQFTVTH